MAELHQWDIQPGESAKAYAAFACYRDLGEDRSLLATGERLKKHPDFLAKWSSRHRWVARAKAFDTHVAILAAAQAVDDHVATKARHAAAGKALQEWGQAVIEATAADAKPADGIAAIVRGVAVERKARDIPDRAPVDEDGNAVAPVIAVLGVGVDGL